MFFRRKVPHEAEFTRLIERWSGYVRKTLYTLDPRRSKADLEEIEQEIRLRLWQVLSRERTWDKPASFIRSVVLSVAIDAARRRQVRGGDSEHVGLDHLEPWASGEVIDPTGAVEDRTQLLAVLETLQREDPEKAEALGLYLQGFTTLEIGNLLGWTEAKARNIVYRCLDALRVQAIGTEATDREPGN
ncbi:MAG TPA: RNA polymerase sigma factor [Xanthomonadales bacterium]|nr:RNA polymerase sigma factor [Xanthomonadales bacterium]